MEPRYQELKREDISKVEREDVTVRIIAGESFGVQSPVYTQTPTMFLDFTLSPGSKVQQLIPESWSAFVYIVEGEGVFGDPSATAAGSHHALVLSHGDGVEVWNRAAKPLRFVLVGGQPLRKPVVQYGPFVMNTQAEIQQAIEDYNYCKNGFERARLAVSDVRRPKPKLKYNVSFAGAVEDWDGIMQISKPDVTVRLQMCLRCDGRNTSSNQLFLS